jgi:ATP-dependent DNA helicase RecG
MPEQLPLGLELVDVDILTVDEIWSGATATTLRRLREDRRIERKPCGIHGPELAEYVSMWANTTDGGLIAIGVENRGDVSGCRRLGPSGTNSLETDARNHCPDARWECRRIPAVNTNGIDDYILLIRVYYNSRKVVRTSRGEAYIRYGDQKRKLSPEEIREMEGAKGQVDTEQELCQHVTYPDDFDVDLVNLFIGAIRERHANYPAELRADEILELRHLGKRDGNKFIPNTACVILFAKDPTGPFPGSKIRFLRHEGEQEGTGADWNAVKDIPIVGPLPYMIEDAARVLRQQLREYSRLGQDGKFTPTYEYPEDAWFEAVVNACVHRSYGPLKNMNIFVRMFDDRLEVESPGGFPPPVTPDNIYDTHQPRNPHLMDAMMHMNYVKCAREGARRMRDSMRAADLPVPHFAQKFGTHFLVRVLLRNNNKQREIWIDADATPIIGENAAKTLSEAERRAVNFIAQNGRANTSEIKRLLRCDWETASKMLQRLTGKGFLKHIHRADLLRDPKAHFILAPRQEGDPGDV